MFSVQRKRAISDAVQAILRDTNNTELPDGEIQFSLHVWGAEGWNSVDIQNNGAVTDPSVNPHNERQDSTPPLPVANALADGVPLHRIENQLDDEENMEQPVTGGCDVAEYPADEPQVDPLVCFEDAMAAARTACNAMPDDHSPLPMLGALVMIRKSVTAMGVFKAESSRIDRDLVRAQKLVEKARAS